MSTAGKAVQWALDTAYDDRHGYDQSNRWGPDYDCSSLVISAYKEAGLPLSCTYTGNMRADMLSKGFRDVTGEVNLQTGAGLEPGDVLLNERAHTAIYAGSGKIVNAGGNETGGVTGGKTGDQTGGEIAVKPYYNFPWEYVLRYDEKPADGVYIVKSGDSLWTIAEKLLGDPWRYHEIEKLNGLQNAVIYPGQALKIPGLSGPVEQKVTLTITVDGETAQLLQIMADGWGKTVGEVIDKLMEDAR